MPKKKDSSKLDLILYSALQILSEKGYYEIKISDIASMSRISTGSIYTYFEDKNLLMNRLYQKLKQDRVAYLVNNYSPHKDIMDNLTNILKAYIYNLYLNPKITRFINFFEFSNEINEESIFVKTQANERFIELISIAIEKGYVTSVPPTTDVLISHVKGSVEAIVNTLLEKKSSLSDEMINQIFNLYRFGIKN